MQTTPNMGLIQWELVGDFFTHAQLAANFGYIDDHDHTATKGKLIPYGGLDSGAVGTAQLRDASVTTVKLNDTSVTTAKVADGAVTTAKLANNGVTAAKLTTGYPTVASAATITLGADSVTKITGTTNITSVTAATAGRRVTLVFTGVLTFTDGSNLKLAGNFVTTADATITLVSNGTNWYETSRAVN